MSNIVGLSTVAIVGSDATLTGAAALDLARAEARHRRVTVIDLIGDAPPLRAVAVTDDPHGVADCFEYGLSFEAVIRPTTVHPNVRIMPSGSEPIPYEQALVSARWDSLIERSRSKGGLLVFAVLISTPALAALTSRVDCVVAAPLRLREVLEADQAGTALASRARGTDARPTGVADAAPPAPAARPGRRIVTPAGPAPRRWLVPTLAAASVLLLTGLGWAITKRRAAPAVTAATPIALSDSTQTRTDTVTSSAQLASSGAAEAAADAAAAGPASPLDPGDSSAAATYAVRVATYPTYIAALRALRRYSGRRGAITISPSTLLPASAGPAGTANASQPVYLLMVGAAHAAGNLDSVVAHWPPQAGAPPSVVVRAPFALRLAGALSADSARRLTAALVARGIPAYVLVRPSAGTSSSVYAGAFETASASVALATSLRGAGLSPVIAYRTGVPPSP